MRSRLALTPAEREAGRPDPDTVQSAGRLHDAYGALVVEGAFPVPLLERLHAELVERYWADGDPDHLPYRSIGPRRYQVVVEMSGGFADPMLYANPLLMPIVRRILGERVVMHSLGCSVSFPGAGPQRQHIDAPRLFESEEVNTALPTYAVNVLVPLVDVGGEVGSTALYEGSHRLPRDAGPVVVSPEPVVAPVGACYLYDYRTWHFGTENRGDHPRPLLYMVYARPWFRDPVNVQNRPLRVPDRVLDEVPEPYRPLFSLVRPSYGSGVTVQ